MYPRKGKGASFLTGEKERKQCWFSPLVSSQENPEDRGRPARARLQDKRGRCDRTSPNLDSRHLWIKENASCSATRDLQNNAGPPTTFRDTTTHSDPGVGVERGSSGFLDELFGSMAIYTIKKLSPSVPPPNTYEILGRRQYRAKTIPPKEKRAFRASAPLGESGFIKIRYRRGSPPRACIGKSLRWRPRHDKKGGGCELHAIQSGRLREGTAVLQKNNRALPHGRSAVSSGQECVF